MITVNFRYYNNLAGIAKILSERSESGLYSALFM